MLYVRLSAFLVGLLLVTGGLAGQEKSAANKSEPKTIKKVTPSKGRQRLPAYWGQLGLSTEQRQKVYGVQAKYDAEIDKLEAQIKELKDKMGKERLDVLSADQKKKLDDIIRAKSGR
jgi:hypothetical protein